MPVIHSSLIQLAGAILTSSLWLNTLAAAEIRDPVKPKIGVVVALSGHLAAVGTAIKNSVTLAWEKHGGKEAPELIFEDDGFLSRNTVSAVNRLLALDGMAAIITFGSGTSLSVSDIIEAREIPHIALAIAEKVNTGKKFVVRHFVSTDALNKKIVEEVKRREYKNIALITTVQEAMIAQREHFLADLNERVIINKDVLPDDTDFRSIVARIKAEAPAAVGLFLLPPQISIFARNLRGAGFKGEIFGSLPMGVVSEIRAAGGALEGAWFVSGDDRGAKEFYREYEARFGDSGFAEIAHAFDATKMVLEGLRSNDLNNYLHTVQGFSGILGTYGADGKNGYNVGIIVKKIRGNAALVD